MQLSLLVRASRVALLRQPLMVFSVLAAMAVKTSLQLGGKLGVARFRRTFGRTNDGRHFLDFFFLIQRVLTTETRWFHGGSVIGVSGRDPFLGGDAALPLLGLPLNETATSTRQGICLSSSSSFVLTRLPDHKTLPSHLAIKVVAQALDSHRLKLQARLPRSQRAQFL
ncbi:hypothetical protein P43SY_011375 [Pythium insidiosum]|uniref:Uncharacterized protein n=1 Tax=Pythium insidiosum TaxID=114742 RepID=A0AAD5Q495_PYTIN|nr:hypothetical protein P43SY_011375 [Pythium insidiosum]